MISKNILKDLKDIIEENLDPSMFPYQKGNSIRIGKMVVRENRHGYLVYDIETNSQVAKTFCKTAAVAVARTFAKKQNISKVLDLDKIIEKHYNDCVFYKHTIKNTKDSFKRETTWVRYNIARDLTTHAKRELDRFIFY